VLAVQDVDVLRVVAAGHAADAVAEDVGAGDGFSSRTFSRSQ
jgi:hypothetical protein